MFEVVEIARIVEKFDGIDVSGVFLRSTPSSGGNLSSGIVFGFDVSVEGGIGEVGLSTHVAVVGATFVIVFGSSLAPLFIYILFEFHFLIYNIINFFYLLPISLRRSCHLN